MVMQTSHEMEKGRYHSSPNPYDKGALENIREYLFEKLLPPRVDFRAAAEPTWGPTVGGESEGEPSAPSDDAGRQAMRDARS